MAGPFSTFESTYRKLMPAALQQFLTDDDLNKFLRSRYDFLENRTGEIDIRIQDWDEFPWLINSSTIEVGMPDSPFITDTVLDYLNSESHRIHLSIPALLTIHRGSKGIESIEPRTGDQNTEAFVYVEVQKLSEREKKNIEKDLRRNLQELRQVVQDFPVALQQLRALDLANEELAEDREWIAENFVTLGSAQFSSGKLQKPTGLLRESGVRKQALTDLKRLFESRGIDPQQLSASGSEDHMLFHESQIMSRVNRHRALHLIVIPSRPLYLLAGHFAGRGELTPRFLNPPARRKVEILAEKIYAPPNSHRRKLLFQIAQMIPVGIFLSRPQQLVEVWLTEILDNLYVDEPDFVVNLDSEYEMIWILGIVSGTEASAFSPEHIARIAGRFQFSQEILIRRRTNEHEIMLLAVTPNPGIELKQLQSDLASSVSHLFASWQNRFRKALTNHFIGERLIEEKLAIYRNALSPASEVHQDPEEALQDLIRLEELSPDRELKAAFFRKMDDVFIKFYSYHERAIGDLVPVLANFGFRVTDEFTFPGNFPDGSRYIYAYRIQDSDLDSRYDTALARVLESVILKSSSDEPINRLAVYGLDRHQLGLIKALQAYLFQIDRNFSRAFIARASLIQREFIQTLVLWMEYRFAPGLREPEKEQETLDHLHSILDGISSVMESLLCKRLMQIASAIVRTNHFEFLPEISFKIRSHELSDLAAPVPLFEIFVYCSDFEAVHLRGASIARGGIRWSDRPDDFRTEIHGLMKAQMVKNTIIVPSGSKGGFCLKGERSTDPAFALECYQRFMSAMLYLTDNRSATGKVKRPPMVCLDNPDPYLVVAADKGTARFSDYANEVSLKAGFWLGDAFASGGKHGYDHKKQGITARGAWQSVRRHFHEMGQDPESDAITVVGIGDMAGDVFGNGMLLSRSMRLVAAFNHKHIFLDPEPKAESWKERKRLFDQVLGWDGYNQSLISKGGGIFARSSARIAVSSEVQNCLGISAPELSGEELIRAILRAPVDLLWNGGIGTYVKASSESDSDAMDPGNDRVRINGNEIRARVIGEGGNLGFTQKARIEAASSGTRLNTDAIDNSGGVDMSDHEVNLKILLEQLLRTGQITDFSQRNQWIEKLEDRMIELVLENNRAGNLCLSLDQKRLQQSADSFLASFRWLESCGHQLEGLSAEDLHLSDHPARYFVRPVLCSMLGHARLELKNEILESGGFKPELEHYLLDYFPSDLVEAFPQEVRAHPLRKEIIVTQVLNHCVNFGGITFFWSTMQKTGASAAQIALNRLAVESFIRAPELREENHVNATAEMQHLLSIEEQVESMTAMLLMHSRAALDLLNASSDDRQRFARILEFLELHCTDTGDEKKSGAECMDRAFWLFLQIESTNQETLHKYVSIIQSDAMQTVDRYLRSPVSPYKAEMRFYRRIREKRDRIVREMLLNRLPVDRLSRLRSMTDGDDTQKALAIYEGLESVLSRAPA